MTGWKGFSLKDWLTGLLKPGNLPEVGTEVFHPSYGEGVIAEIKGSGPSARVTVDFGYAKPVVQLSELVFDLEGESGTSLNEPEDVSTHETYVRPEKGIPHEYQTHENEIADEVESQLNLSEESNNKLDYGPSFLEVTNSQPGTPQQKLSTVPTDSDSQKLPHEQRMPPTGAFISPLESEFVDKFDDESKPLSKRLFISTAPPHVIDARKGLMALRLGQVLESQVLNLSIGVADIEREFRNSVTTAINGQPVFILVDASWGAGKTHALTMLQAIARSKNLATSFVVMDGVSASLTFPMELMGEIMSSLRFSDDPVSCDLAYQLSKARNQNIMGFLKRQGAHFIPETLSSLPIEAFNDSEVMEAICEFLSLKASAANTNWELQKRSYYSKLKSIKSSRLADRPSRFVSLIKEWAIFSSSMNCNGLLVILDELDVEYAHSSARSTTAENMRKRRRELLEQLSQLHQAPLIVAFGAAPGGYDENEETDPVLDIKKCFGHRIKHINIPPPEKSDYRVLLDRLLNLYADAYGLDKNKFDSDMTDGVFSELFEDYQREPNAVIRRFVRSAIERMDISFLHDSNFTEKSQGQTTGADF